MRTMSEVQLKNIKRAKDMILDLNGTDHLDMTNSDQCYGHI